MANFALILSNYVLSTERPREIVQIISQSLNLEIAYANSEGFRADIKEVGIVSEFLQNKSSSTSLMFSL